MFSHRMPAPPQKRIDSPIGAGTVVRGDVVFCGSLRVDGQVEDNLTTVHRQPGTLVRTRVGVRGRIKARDGRLTRALKRLFDAHWRQGR